MNITKQSNRTHTAVAVFAKTKSWQKQCQPMRRLLRRYVALPALVFILILDWLNIKSKAY
jgi:hypothetical protein